MHVVEVIDKTGRELKLYVDFGCIYRKEIIEIYILLRRPLKKQTIQAQISIEQFLSDFIYCPR